MAVDHWWLGTTSADHAVAANWSTAGSGGAPGASVPGTGNEVLFDGNGNNPCTLSANWTVQNLTTVAGYTAKLDLATFNTPFDAGGSVTLDGGGEFDMGTGTMTVTNFDNKDQATFTRGASTLVMAGTGTIIGNLNNDLHKLTIAASATIELSSSTTGSLDVVDRIDVLGQLTISDELRVFEQITVQAGGSVIGTGTLAVIGGAADGVTLLDGAISAPVEMRNNATGIRLIAGSYTGAVKLRRTVGTDFSLELDAAGIYVFGSLEFEVSGAGNYTLDNSANGPASIRVIGAFTRDIQSTGSIIIDDSGQDVAWILEGGKVEAGAGGGVFQWIHDLSQFPRREYLAHGGLMTGGRL